MQIRLTDRSGPKRAVIGASFKLIDGGDGNLELYALEDDPGERRNLASRGGSALERLTAALERFEARARTPSDTRSLDLSESEREALRALGYGPTEPN